MTTAGSVCRAAYCVLRTGQYQIKKQKVKSKNKKVHAIHIAPNFRSGLIVALRVRLRIVDWGIGGQAGSTAEERYTQPHLKMAFHINHVLKGPWASQCSRGVTLRLRIIYNFLVFCVPFDRLSRADDDVTEMADEVGLGR